MSEKVYDFLIVGAGLFGSVFAHELHKMGRKCLVVDKREHAGGNVYCEDYEGIRIHRYGAHIFHTNNRFIWDYVNRFVEFNNYVHSPMANYKGALFNLPFNMNTFYQLWKLKTPEEVIARIGEQKKELNGATSGNLEDQAINLVGTDLYNILIKGYTEKQWGRSARELPGSIIKRLPLRFTYDNRYFPDKFQGIPIGGYNKLINGLLEGIEVRLNINYLENRNELDQLAENILFTGPVDSFFDFRFGKLAYRSLSFEHSIVPVCNYQGCAVMNYTDREVPYTRVIEHKHFEFGRQPFSAITFEYPRSYTAGGEPYYPINDEVNNRLLKKYQQAALERKNVFFGGRLGEYKYYDMDQVIGSALAKVRMVMDRDKVSVSS